ncbi:MAG TPA: 2TM domain-containing protein [Armatimonadota bacterium]|jgi:hypothetical protein
MKPHYSEEESNDILRRAIENMPLKDAMSLEQLEKIGAELGISPEALRLAEAEHLAEGGRRELYSEFLAHERGAFQSALYSFIGVNAFLFAFNYLTTRGFWWFVFPLLGMGLGLFKHWVRANVRDSQDHIDAYNDWLHVHHPGPAPKKELPPRM